MALPAGGGYENVKQETGVNPLASTTPKLPKASNPLRAAVTKGAALLKNTAAANAAKQNSALTALQRQAIALRNQYAQGSEAGMLAREKGQFGLLQRGNTRQAALAQKAYERGIATRGQIYDRMATSQFKNLYDALRSIDSSADPMKTFNSLSLENQFKLVMAHPYADEVLTNSVAQNYYAWQQQKAAIEALHKKKGFFSHGIGNVVGAPARGLLSGLGFLTSKPGEGIDELIKATGGNVDEARLYQQRKDVGDITDAISTGQLTASKLWDTLSPQQKQQLLTTFNKNSSIDLTHFGGIAGSNQKMGSATGTISAPGAGAHAVDFTNPVDDERIRRALDQILTTDTAARQEFARSLASNTDLSYAAAQAGHFSLFSHGFVNSLLSDPGQALALFLPSDLGVLNKLDTAAKAQKFLSIASKVESLRGVAGLGKLAGRLSHPLDVIASRVLVHPGDVMWVKKILGRSATSDAVDAVMRASEKGRALGGIAEELEHAGSPAMVAVRQELERALGKTWTPKVSLLTGELRGGGRLASSLNHLASQENGFGRGVKSLLQATHGPVTEKVLQTTERVSPFAAQAAKRLERVKSGLGFSGALRGAVNDALVAAGHTSGSAVRGIVEKSAKGGMSLTKEALQRLELGGKAALASGKTITKADLAKAVESSGAYGAFGQKALDVARAEVAAVAAGVKVRASTLDRVRGLAPDVRQALALDAARAEAPAVRGLSVVGSEVGTKIRTVEGLKGERLRAALRSFSGRSSVPVTKDMLFREALPHSARKGGLSLGETWEMRAKNFVQDAERSAFEKELLARPADPRADILRALDGKMKSIDSNIDRLKAMRVTSEKLMEPKQEVTEAFKLITQPHWASGVGKVVRAWKTIGASAPQALFWLHGSTVRAEQVSRLGFALGVGKDAIDGLAARAFHLAEGDAAGAGTIIKEMLGHAATKAGIDSKALVDRYNKELQRYFSEVKNLGVYGAEGEHVAQVFEQMKNHIPVPNYLDVQRTIKDIKAGKTFEGFTKNRGVRAGLQRLQNKWKFLLIAAPAYAGGAVGGLVGGAVGIPLHMVKVIKDALLDIGTGARALEEPGLKGLRKEVEKGWKVGSARGIALGTTLGGAHYIIKIPGLYEGVLYPAIGQGWKGFAGRMPFGIGKSYFHRGLTADEVAAREGVWAAHQAEVDVHFNMDFMGGKGLKYSTGERALISRDDPEFLRAWGHAVNAQISDANPVVSRLLVDRFEPEEKRAITRLQAQKWLDHDPAGIRWRDAFLKQHGEFKSSEDIVKGAQNLMDEVITTPLIRDERVAGMVSEKALKRAAADGLAPKAIHSVKQDYLSLTSFQKLAHGVTRNLFENPHNVARRAYAEAEYDQQLRNLMASGMSVKEAANIAAERAIKTTNDVFVRIDEHSLFARKADLFVPFIGIHLQNVVKLPRLLLQNPLRTIKVAKVAALAFNDARNRGMFKKDSFGHWVMVVPGSSFISRIFGQGDHPVSFGLSNLFTFTEGPFNIGVVPAVGGVFTGFGVLPKVLLGAYPHIFDSLPEPAQKILWPYGINGNVDNSAFRNIATYLFHGTPPWDFAERQDQENATRKAYQANVDSLIADYMRTNNLQSFSDIPANVLDGFGRQAIQQTHNMFLMKGILGALWPAAVSPVLPSNEEFSQMKQAYRLSNGGVDYGRMIKDHPWVAPLLGFTSATGQRVGSDFVGPDDYWSQPGMPGPARTEAEKAVFKNAYKYWDMAHFLQGIKDAQQLEKDFTDRRNIDNIPDFGERQIAMDEWDAKHPQYDAWSKSDYAKGQEYWRARNIAGDAERAAALAAWRRKFSVSVNSERKLSNEYSLGGLTPNAWAEARSIDIIRNDWAAAAKHQNYAQFAAKLTAAEAYKFYSDLEANYKPAPGQTWASIKKQMSAFETAKFDISKSHDAELFPKNPYSFQKLRVKELNKQYNLKSADELHALWTKNSGTYYTRVAQLKAQQKAAVAAKNWTFVKSLSAQIREEYTHITALRNAMYARFPDINRSWDFLKEGIWGNVTPATIARIKGEGGYLVVDPEQKQWNRWNDDVKRAYLDNLKGNLDQFFHFDWLSDFQRDLVQGFFTPGQVHRWASMTAADYKRLSAAHFKHGIGVGGALAYALELFRKYNKRGGMAKPAGYDQYLKIDPHNSELRVAFLDAHPEVRAYVAAGPMANMPPLFRNLVANIMIQNGKWSGTEMSPSEITDLSWAEMQLQKYTKRQGVTKPSALDLWMKMPTGAQKQAYFHAHPEISDWLGRGPLANMPNAVKEVVRDIMLAYGKWTESQDPLSKELHAYSLLPAHEKQAWLQSHPEVIDYWRSLRPVDQRPLFDLSQQYFGIQDANAKKAFIEAHPELQNYFIDERQRRYQSFLNNVSYFFRSNPEMVQGYLKEQTALLKQLFENYGHRPLTIERFVSGSTHKSRRDAA